MSLRSASSLVAPVAFFAVLLASACASNDATSDESPEADEAELRASCDEGNARRWFVVLDDRSCTTVRGRRGRWVPSPLSGAPDSFCTMSWRGASSPDVAALRRSLSYPEAMTPACSGTKPDVGDVEPAEPQPIHGNAGASGCDVCGVLVGGSVVVVLPPERTQDRRIEVNVSDGSTAEFKIQAPAAARAVSVELPPAPAGLSYVPGRVRVR